MSDSDIGATPSDGWPMGAVARRTGIGEHTLRAWERRFGFPRPERLPSGHRRYPTRQVRQLILIAKALGYGCRAGDVVPLPFDRLRAVVRECEDRDRQPPELAGRRWLEEILAAALELDTAAVADLLRSEAVRLGGPRFLRERLVLLLTEVGEGWAREELSIRHEHLITEEVEGFLRSERGRLGPRRDGPAVLLATLPGELHGLALQLVAYEAAISGWGVTVLGRQLPVEEIVAAAEGADAAAVAISVSVYADPSSTGERILELRDGLGADVALWIGGGGVVHLDLPPGVEALASLDAVAGVLADLEDRRRARGE